MIVVKDNFKLSQEETDKLIDIFKYSDDVAERDKAGYKLYCSLYKYFVSIMSSMFPTYYENDKEDMLNECAVCFFEKIKGYDKSKGALITYMKKHIIHQITEYVNKKNNKTSYYGQQTTKIKRCIKQMEDAGEEWNDIKISERTGIPIYTVKEVLKQENNTIVHIESHTFIEENINDGMHSTPEDDYIAQIEADSVHRAIKNLTAQEEQIIRLYFGLGYSESLSLAKISKKIGLDISKVRRIHNTGMGKITRSIEKEGLFENRVIKREISAIGEEITFIPKSDEILNQLAEDNSIEINF